jgi:hypothetical protein
MKCGQEQSSIFSRTRLLDIKLGKGHEITISQTNEQPSKVKWTNVGCGHHYNVGNGTKKTGQPKTHLPAKFCGNEPS